MRNKRVFLRIMLCMGLSALSACTQTSAPDRMKLIPTYFEAMQGWEQDDHAQALVAFKQSCKTAVPVWRDESYRSELPPLPSQNSWKKLCLHAGKIASNDVRSAKQFFEQYFTPYRVEGGNGEEGLFTGYYAPILRGSYVKNAQYQYPVYRMPADANSYSRKDIDAGALEGKGLELLWLDDKVMRFFMEIQGSGFVQLPDGSRTHVRYAGKNGFPYVAIGKTLIARGEMTKEQMSMPALRQWLYDHPAQADEVMQTNPSYVFFVEDRANQSVKGAQGVPLTDGRSLAVDKQHVPYGVPLYLRTNIPASPVLGKTEQPFARVMMAQDTGGAIKGVVRGDIYFGVGEGAEQLAGSMNASGTLVMLLPHEQIP